MKTVPHFLFLLFFVGFNSVHAQNVENTDAETVSRKPIKESWFQFNSASLDTNGAVDDRTWHTEFTTNTEFSEDGRILSQYSSDDFTEYFYADTLLVRTVSLSREEPLTHHRSGCIVTPIPEDQIKRPKPRVILLTYTFDDQGRVIRKVSFDSLDRNQYETVTRYHPGGRSEQEINVYFTINIDYDQEGQMICRSSSHTDRDFFVHRYEYENGLLVSDESFFRYDSDIEIENHYYEYDAYGECIREEILRNGQSIDLITSTYEYDEYGNWTRCIRKWYGGVDDISRELRYYED